MNVIAKLAKITKKKSVLYVEDDKYIRSNVTELLNNLFGSVTSANDGLDGLETYKTAEYDIVITDIKMPRMNGITMIEEIQKINNDQMIVITTAHDEQEYQERFKELGIAHVLQKPITFDSLLQTLQAIAL